MKQVNIFFSLVIIFLFILTGLSLIFILNSQIFSIYLQKTTTINQLISFIFFNLKYIHIRFVIAALFFTFIIYYSFIDLINFKSRNYVFEVIVCPLLLSALIYYLENFQPFFLNFILNKKIQLFWDNEINLVVFKNLIYGLKIYYFIFLIFIIIPLCLTLNNKNWYLKTLVYLFIVIPLIVYLSQYFNTFILHLTQNVKNYKNFPDTKEIILSLCYIALGIYLFKVADQIRNIKTRINLEKVRKIHR